MFGRKSRKLAARLPVQAGAFMTLGEATVAVCADHSDPSAAVKYFGNVLLGAMASFGIGPDDGPDEHAIWSMVRKKFGGELLGDNWRASVKSLDVDTIVNHAESIAPLMVTPRERVEHVFSSALAPYFGQRNAVELELTALLPCLISGIALRTIFEDALEHQTGQRDDRVSIGSMVVAAYLDVARYSDALQKPLAEVEEFRVLMTPLQLDLAGSGGFGTMRVEANGSASFKSDTGAKWNLGDLAETLSDYTLGQDGSLSAGFNPPMPLWLRVEGADANRLDSTFRRIGCTPASSS